MPGAKAIAAAGEREPAGVAGDSGAAANAGETAAAPVDTNHPRPYFARTEHRPDALAEGATMAEELARVYRRRVQYYRDEYRLPHDAACRRADADHSPDYIRAVRCSDPERTS